MKKLIQRPESALALLALFLIPATGWSKTRTCKSDADCKVGYSCKEDPDASNSDGMGRYGIDTADGLRATGKGSDDYEDSDVKLICQKDEDKKKPEDEDDDKRRKDDEKRAVGDADQKGKHAKTHCKGEGCNNLQIEEKHSGKYGGYYGGFDPEVSQVVNTAGDLTTTFTKQVGAAQTQNNNVNQNMQLQAKGTALSFHDANHAKAEELRNGAKETEHAAKIEYGVAGAEGIMALAHEASKAKVKHSRNEAEADIQKRMSQDLDDESAAGLRQRVGENFKREKQAQNAAALAQVLKAGTSAADALLMQKQAEGMRAQADMLDKLQQPTTPPPSLVFNPAAPPPNPNASVAPEPTVQQGGITASDSPSGGLPTTPAFNPNPGDGGVAGGPGGHLGDAPAGSNGGGGGGVGSPGNSSAAKDDGSQKPDANALTAKGAGQYGAGDGNSPRFSRNSGGGAGVAVDPNFADLLKKFLPGEEEKKKDTDALAFDGDRAIAGEGAATVLGRNTNIFKEISKAYGKKNREGAVLFVDDHRT